MTMRIFSVSEFNTAISGYLEQGLGSVAVQGEVVDFRVNRDRLVYFELKDEKARVLCFSLKWEMPQVLEDGMEVVVVGLPKLFHGSGGFHIRVQAVELKGEGALRRAFELTKKKLEGEGIFDPQYKKPLPRFPERIGLVTSHEAAAYTDVLRILQNRWGGMEIYVASVHVQGAVAVNQITRAIEYFNTSFPVDVLLLTRGGGSLEDLQAFNSEKVARAVFGSKIPIVVGVGHERDETLAEYAADVRASTPSNAAEMMVPDRKDVQYQVDQMISLLSRQLDTEVQRRAQAVELQISHLGRLVEGLMGRSYLLLHRFRQSFSMVEQRISLLLREEEVARTRLTERIGNVLRERGQTLGLLTKLLGTLNPLATLRRGYSITFYKGRVVKSAGTVHAGDSIATRLADGTIESIVK